MRHGQGAWRLIILFQHNLPILQQAVDGYVSAAPSRIFVQHFGHKQLSHRLYELVFHFCACLCLAMLGGYLFMTLTTCMSTPTVPTPTNITPNDHWQLNDNRFWPTQTSLICALRCSSCNCVQQECVGPVRAWSTSSLRPSLTCAHVVSTVTQC
jgi:hypothetical protein